MKDCFRVFIDHLQQQPTYKAFAAIRLIGMAFAIII